MLQLHPVELCLNRAAKYVEMLLVDQGFQILHANNLNAYVRVAGKPGNAFIALFDWIDTPTSKPEPEELPAELLFLNLPVRRFLVTETKDAKHTYTDIFGDPEVVALFPRKRIREFGIGLFSKTPDHG